MTKTMFLPFKRTVLRSLLAVLFALSLMGLKAGDKAPDFSMKNQDGKTVKLSQFHGKPVLLYFYPKDDTPGCTQEACVLRDYYTQFEKAGAVILGVSKQGKESHQAFRKKHRLPFDLLTDKEGDVAKTYGVESFPGVGFLKRKSFLIDRNGMVNQYYQAVVPAEHAAEVLKDLKALNEANPAK